MARKNKPPPRSPQEEQEIHHLYKRAYRYARYSVRPDYAEDFAAWCVARRLSGTGLKQRMSYSWIDFCRQEVGSSAGKLDSDLLSRWWDRLHPRKRSDGTYTDPIEEGLQSDPLHSNNPTELPDRHILLTQLRKQIPARYLWLYDSYILRGLRLKDIAKSRNITESRVSQIWTALLRELAKLRDK